MTTLTAPYDTAPPQPVAPRRRLTVRSAVGWIVFVSLFVAYALLLFSRFAPAITQPDDNGYFAQASLMVRQHSTWFTMASPAQYVGMHWLLVPGDEHKLVPRYPAGLPALIAVPYALFGWRAAVLTNPALALGCLLAVFLLAKRLTGRTTWGLTAAAILAVNPPFVEHALSGDSHIGVACFLAWSMYLLWVWHETRNRWVALFAGIAIGAIPTIRYADCVMYLGLAMCVAWSIFGDWNFWRRRFPLQTSSPARNESPISRAWAGLGIMALGAFLTVLPILVRNHFVLGHFWKTGYDLTNEQTGFSMDWFKQHYSLYLDSLLSNGMGVFYGIGLLGIVGMLGSRRYRGMGLAAAFAVVPMVLLYMAYYWAGMGQNGAGIMRFMVPVFIPLAIGGAWAVAEIGNKLAFPARIALPLILLAFQGYWGIPELNAQLDRQQYQRTNLAIVTSGMEGTVEPGAVVIADNGLLQHLDFVRQWKLADAGNFRGTGQGFRGFGRSEDQPSPQQPAKSKYMATLYHGTPDERKDAFYKDCQTWAAGNKVYFVGTESDAKSLAGGNSTIKIVKRIPLPPVADANNNDGPPGGGPGGGMGGPPPDGGPGGRFGGPGGGGPGGGFFGMGGGGGGGGRANGRGFGGQGGGNGGRRPGGGGMMNAGNFNGAAEVVVAEWTIPALANKVQPVSK